MQSDNWKEKMLKIEIDYNEYRLLMKALFGRAKYEAGHLGNYPEAEAYDRLRRKIKSQINEIMVRNGFN